MLRAGLTTTADAYLAAHLKEGKVRDSVSFELIAKVAGKLVEMSNRILPDRKSKKSLEKRSQPLFNSL